MNSLSKFEFKAASSIPHAWDLRCRKWERHKHTHTLSTFEIMKAEGRSFCDVSCLSDSWGWFQHFTRLLSCQSRAQRWDRGAPRNQSKLNYYLSDDNHKNISFLSPSQNEVVVVVVGSCEEIKSVKIINECNYWIISHIVHLLRSIPVTREIIKYCIAFLHFCNHINVYKGTANDIHMSCLSLP